MTAMHTMNDNFDNDDDEYHVDSSADDVDGDDDSIGGRGTNDDDDDPSSSDGGNGGGRARKRDLLRTRITKKLNTDYLFRGMPGIESMLGGGGGLSLSSSSTTASSTGDEEGHDRGGGGGGGGRRTIPTTGSDDSSRLQNQYITGAEKDARLDELLTYEEIRAIDDKYDAQKRASGITIPDTLLMMGDENNDDDNNSNNNNNNNFIDKEDNNNNNNETLLISRNEAKRIIDYTIEEEKNMELRNLRYRKKEELVARWEEQNANVDDVGTDGNYDNNYENDGLVNEIVTNDDERYSLENAKRAQINELELYYKEQMMQRQLSVDEEDVNSSSSSSISGDATVDNAKSNNFDTLYEETINTLQTSRYDKLRARTLGVLSNSLALEDSLEYIRRKKRLNEFDTSVKKELINNEFIKPRTVEEDRIYRSIIRQIVHRRKKEGMIEEVVEERTVCYDNDEDEDEDESTNFESRYTENSSNKYELTVNETIESYKLLNLWREIKTIQDVMEVEVGIKDTIDDFYDPSSITTALTKRIEPLFLYEENTNEKRQKEKDGLSKALRTILKLDHEKNNAELSSNELLMKELFIIEEEAGGGITKDRALRLIDKLLQTTSDDTIKNTLMELKGVILEEDEDNCNDITNISTKVVGRGGYRFRKSKPTTSSGPIDLSGIFRTTTSSDIDDTITSQSSPPSSSSMGSGFSRTMPSWVGRGDEETTTTPPSPNVASFDVSPDKSSYESTSDSYDYDNDEDYENEIDEEVNVKSSNTGGGMFGTYEEQRLRKLAKRVGAQTESELDELRRNMESLRLAEDIANAELSNDENFDLASESAKLGIDVRSLNLDDDNDGQIMSMIGKRPVKPSSSSSSSSSTVTSSNAIETNDGVIVSDSGDIVGDIFRAKNAGRYNDRQARDADEAAFREFVMMEVEAERKLDLLDDGSTADQSTVAIDDIDIDAYAGKKHYSFYFMDTQNNLSTYHPSNFCHMNQMTLCQR